MPELYMPGPCPKCGGERQFYYCDGNSCSWKYGTPWHYDGERFHVSCKRCQYRELKEIPGQTRDEKGE